MPLEEDPHKMGGRRFPFMLVSRLSVNPVRRAYPVGPVGCSAQGASTLQVVRRGQVRSRGCTPTKAAVPGEAFVVLPQWCELPPLTPLEPGPKTTVHVVNSAEVDIWNQPLRSAGGLTNAPVRFRLRIVRESRRIGSRREREFS